MGTLASAVSMIVRPDAPTRRGPVRRPAAARFAARLALVLVGLGTLVGWATSPAGAQTNSCAKHGCVDVVAVNGLVDGIEADFIVDTLASARRSDGVVAVVLQFDSGGSAVGDERLDQVARAIVDSDVPVSVWIGPSGSEALGGSAELVQVADSSGIAPGASIGDVGAQRLSVDEFGDLFTGKKAKGLEGTLTGQAAVRAGLVTRFSPTVGDHLVNLDGVKTETRTEDGERRTVPLTTVRFSKLPLTTQLFHTVASPSVAYLLLTIGLGLLLFEFFTAGIGIAGVAGALFTVLGGYGLAELPHAPWALVVFVASFVAFGIDVQTGIPRLWTAIGLVGFTVSSVFLLTEFRPTWIALIAGIGGIAATMITGMPAMVRTRFSTPTIDRDWLVGESGRAATPIDLEGNVKVAGALWRARADTDASVPSGAAVRVVAVDGVVLEVEADDTGLTDGTAPTSGTDAPDPLV